MAEKYHMTGLKSKFHTVGWLYILAMTLLFILSIRATDAATTTYTYDAQNRLIGVDFGNGGTITYSYDAMGNRITVSSTPIDTIPPATTASMNPAANTNGWNNAPVTVTLSASDNQNSLGVSTVHYQLNAEPEVIISGNQATTVVSTEGVNSLTYWSVDQASNEEPPNTLEIKIDTILPIIDPLLQSPPNSADWHNADVAIMFSCSDEGSSVATCSSPITIVAEGEGQVVNGFVEDMAGNSASTSILINLDKTPPDLIMPLLNSSYPYRQTFTLNYDAQDTLSGINTMQATLNGITVNSGNTITLGLDYLGQNTFTLMATDKAGNQAMQSLSFEVLNTPPTAEAGVDLSLDCLEMSCPVIMDGSGSTDPNSTSGTQDDIISYEWYENYDEIDETLLASGMSTSIDLPLGDHLITLMVTDTVGDQGQDTIQVSVNPAQLSLLEISKAEVEWEKEGEKPNRFTVHGKVAMPAGKDYFQIYPVGTVMVGISTANNALNQAMAFQTKGDYGSKWEYKAEPMGIGISKYKIDWHGGRFDYNQEIRIKSNHLGHDTTSLEIDRKNIRDPIMITVQDITIRIDSTGAVTVSPASLKVDLDDDEEVEVLLPFALSMDTVISISHGDTSYQVKVGDHYSAAVGKFEIMGQFNPSGLSGASRPATMDLLITLGNQGFHGTYKIMEGDWKQLKAVEWKYKR